MTLTLDEIQQLSNYLGRGRYTNQSKLIDSRLNNVSGHVIAFILFINYFNGVTINVNER